MIVAFLLIAAILSVPVLNENYFHIKNLSELRREAGNRFSKINNLYMMGDAKGARDSTRMLIEYFSKNSDDISQTAAQLGMFQLAASEKQNAVSRNNYEEAIYDFKKLLEKYPESPVAEQVFLLMAKCYIALGDMGEEPNKNYQKAIDNLETIEKNRPEALNFPKYKQVEFKPGKYFNIDRGKQKLQNRDLVKKLYTRKELIRETATDTTQVKAELLSDAVMEIGHCLTKMGEGDRAREQYKILINYFKESDLVDDAQKAIGDAFVKEGDIIQARIEKEPDLIAAQKDSLLQRRAFLYAQAAETYQKFIIVYLQSDLLSKVMIALGGVYFKMDRPKEAYEVFSRAINSIKVIEEQARVQLDIGNYYYSERKWDDAIENYSKVLQNYSGTQYAANAQFLLAECYESKGDTNTAIKAYVDVTENFKTSIFYPAAALKIGQYYMQSKDYVKAQQVFRQSINRYPQSQVAAQTQFLIGAIYMEMASASDSSDAETKYRLAIKEFETLTGNYDQVQEWYEKAILEMGKCYMKLSNKEKARETLNSLRSQTMMVEKYRILGVEGSDSAILSDYGDQLAKLTDDQAKSVIWIEIGRKLMGDELNKIDSAITVFNKAISMARDSVTIMTAFGELGNCYSKKNDYKKARQIYTDEILNRSKCDEQRRVQFSFKVAETYFRDKAYGDADSAFKKFVDKYPENAQLTPPSLYLLAKSQHSLGQFAEAQKSFQRVFDQFPKSDMVENCALGYAEALAGEEKYEEAIRYALAYLKKNPGAVSAPNFYYKVADLYKTNLKKPDSGIVYYSKILNFADSYLYSGSAYMLGRLYSEQGKDDNAIAAYEKVRKDNVEYFRAAQGEIGSLKARTDPAGAIQNYEKIESSSEDVADKVIARMGIGDVYLGQKKFPEAVESYRIIYEKYLTASPDLRAVSIIKIIDALNSQEKYADMVSWSEKMIRDFPTNRYIINAYYSRANAYFYMKKFKEARERFKEVVDRDTGSLGEVSLYQRAECLMSMGDQGSAVKEFGIFMERHPKSGLVANALFQMGNVEWGKENWAAAKKNYTRIIGEYPQFTALCWVKNYLAFCYDKEDSWRKALEIYNQVRDGQCDKECKQFAKEQIQSIRVRH